MVYLDDLHFERCSIALWERQLTVVIPLCLLCIAHWAILCRSMFIVSATYDPTTKLCAVWSTDHVFLNVEFFMSEQNF